MNFTDIVKVSDIYLDSQSSTINEVLLELSNKFPENIQDKIYNLLVEREEQSSTAICNAAAIPHCKLNEIQNINLIVLRTIKALDCSAHDKQNTKLFFLIVSHPKKTTEHIKVLAKIGRLIKNSEKVSQLLEFSSNEIFYSKLLEFNN